MSQHAPAHPRQGNALPKEHAPYLGRDVGKGIAHAAYDNVLKGRGLTNERGLGFGAEEEALVNEASWELEY